MEGLVLMCIVIGVLVDMVMNDEERKRWRK